MNALGRIILVKTILYSYFIANVRIKRKFKYLINQILSSHTFHDLARLWLNDKILLAVVVGYQRISDLKYLAGRNMGENSENNPVLIYYSDDSHTSTFIKSAA